MKLFQKLKDLMVEWKKAVCRSDWDSSNKLKHKVFEIKRELRALWRYSPTGLLRCPSCHGMGSFGSHWDGDYSDCSYCFHLGFVDQKTKMEFIRSYRGLDPNLRAMLCLDREIG